MTRSIETPTEASSEEGIPLRVPMDDALDGPCFGAMNFLNEAVGRFPNAISLAAGRPPDQHLQTDKVAHWIGRYVAHQGSDTAATWVRLGQYADTAGIMQSFIAQYLHREEQVAVDLADCIVTNGFQEALLLELLALGRRGGALIAMEPTYVGLMGAAAAAGVPLFTFAASGTPAEMLAQTVQMARADGFGALAFYVIPDFANPTGESLDLAARRDLLDVAEAQDLVILEDTAYRVYRYQGERCPTLLALDPNGRVVQLGSFSKMFIPGARIGFSACRGAGRAREGRADAVAIKSFTSVTTAPIAQAIAAGFLLDVDFGVTGWNAGRIGYCRDNRDRMLQALAREFGEGGPVSWSRPEGGFFIVVSLPFAFHERNLVEAAETDGVIVTPMRFFSPRGMATRDVRLAFSHAQPDAIDLGIARFANYVRRQMTIGIPLG